MFRVLHSLVQHFSYLGNRGRSGLSRSKLELSIAYKVNSVAIEGIRSTQVRCLGRVDAFDAGSGSVGIGNERHVRYAEFVVWRRS